MTGKHLEIIQAPECGTGGGCEQAVASVSITVWGDYQEHNTAALDRLFRRKVQQRSDARYTLRHFPVNTSCSSAIRRTKHTGACWASKAAQTAGAEGYWRMHDWLLNNQSRFNDQTLRQIAPQLGFDADALLSEMRSNETAQAIANDVRAGERIDVQGVPYLYINGSACPDGNSRVTTSFS